MTSSSSSKSYFDLHITGLGYLNRIREVTPKHGTPFLACDIKALTGPTNAPEYRRFDVRVSGTDAQHLIRRCEKAVEAKRKVLIGFRLGDLWTDTYPREKGKDAGKPGVSLKARLLFVSWIKIDGETVYKAESKSDSTAREKAPPADPPAADVPAPARAPARDDSF